MKGAERFNEWCIFCINNCTVASLLYGVTLHIDETIDLADLILWKQLRFRSILMSIYR